MRRQLASALLAAAVLMVWLPSGAIAGSFQVSACNYAPEGANNSWVWSTTDSSQPAGFSEHQSCPDRLGSNGGKSDQEGGLSTTDTLKHPGGTPPDTSAGWSISVGKEETITGIEYERYIGHVGDSANSWSPALRAGGVIIPGETCLDTIENDESCSIGGPPGEGGEPARITGLSAHELTLGILCQAPEGEHCVNGATEYATWAAMYGATVTIEDPTPPTLSTPTGPLWQPGPANGYHTGTETVTVSAEDPTSGIQSITLSADGKPIQTYTTTCNYTYTKPCPANTGPQTLTLPTNQLTDGPHTIILTTTDAANNTTTTTEQINISNNPPPPPTNLTATPTPTNTTYTLNWTNPSEQTTPIIQATYQICPTNNQTTTTCQPPTNTTPTGPTTITLPSPGTWTITLWLTNAAGHNNPTNAAHTTITTPTNTTEPENNTKPNTSPTITTKTPDNTLGSGSHPKLHVTVTLRQHRLTVHITGTTSNHADISITGELVGRRTIDLKRKLSLKQDTLTTTFRLTKRASLSIIRVIVRADDKQTVIVVGHR